MRVPVSCGRAPRAPRRASGWALAGVLAAAVPAHGVAAAEDGTGTVAVRAGTIHCVEEGRVLRGERATIVIERGRIVALGEDLEVPPHAELVDYGPDAVIVPGLVAPFSPYGLGEPDPRTASLSTRAVENVDPYREYASGLSGGVTSAYVTPSEARLIAGVGAVVKLSGDDPAQRVLNPRAAIHASVDELARHTPGYWEPPIPASPDQELGYARRQLPASAMGAIVALEELVHGARGGDPDGAAAREYGADTVTELATLLRAEVPWRIAANTTNEIRGVLRLAAAHDLPLVLEKALEAADVASEIAAAGVPVVFRVPFLPTDALADRGKDRDATWARFDAPAALAAQGVRIAIASARPIDLLFSAALARRGGLSEEEVLRAITLTPAELSGVAQRVGSLAVGKDADLCVLNGPPLARTASVLATWVGGRAAWTAHTGDATVIEVDELHVGDGAVLRPGALLLRDGRIVEVGESVSHPRGARVVRGTACMPGIVDALGHLGLDDAKTVPATDFDLASVAPPASTVARRVARHGVTTVVLSPRGASRSGTPVMAYKPAAEDFEHQVVGSPVALRLDWEDDEPLDAGKAVRDLLEKAVEYDARWREYEEAMRTWTPPPPEPEGDDAKADEEASGDEEEDAAEPEEDDGAPKKKKRKKGEEEELEPDPITGRWIAPVEDEDGEEAPEGLKMRLQLVPGQGSGAVVGNLRCARASGILVELDGYWDREAKTLELSGLGDGGWLSLALTHEEGALVGTLSGEGLALALKATRVSREYPVAERPERRKEEAPKQKDPKGKPKEPREDSKLEPFRAALRGELAIVVEVDREDAIVACVDAFAEVGIQPILLGGLEAHRVLDRLAGRVRGVLVRGGVRRWEPDRGTDYLTPYGMLQSAGIPVAFHSEAEEGASELPLVAAYAVANGMSPSGALRALTADAARMMSIGERVGRLAAGLDADVLLLDGPPLAPGTAVRRTWVNGKEIR